MRTYLYKIPAGLAAAYLVVALAGCSGNSTESQVAALNTSNIQRLANMYSAYQNMKSGGGPKDEKDFKAFIKDYDAGKLKMMGIDPNNLDALFTSERDGKPFKIRYKVGGGRGSEAAVVFEQAGNEGKKQVGYTGQSKVEEVDDARYAQLLSGKARPSADAKEGKGPISGVPAGAPKGPPGGIPKGPPPQKK
jgi:hypothetical protein